jgi:predicted nuclease of predicted toxin-antitoxin system
MKIIADENCDRILVAELRLARFDVIWASDLAPSIDDTRIFEIAASDGRLLLTNDRGFGMMAEQMGARRPPAVVLMRLQRLLPASRTAMVVQALSSADKNLFGHFTVIEPHQVRGRRYKD